MTRGEIGKRVLYQASRHFARIPQVLVLGIETSCDETGVALYHDRRGLLGHALHSQVRLHADYGGVVPELASRDHVRRLLPLTAGLLERTGCRLEELTALAYTE